MLLLVAACSTPITYEDLAERQISVGDEVMTVLVASSGKETNLGLSGMEQLPEGIGGMLFEFEGGQTATFHMENTLIPLDLWWFNSEGLVIGFTEMDPCLVDPCVQYRSPGIVTWALETPQGVFDFRPGDRLTNVENE